MGKWMAIGAGVALAGMLGNPAGWAQNSGKTANGGGQPGATRSIQMVPVRATLTRSMNAKKLKVGQAVTAKLDQKVKLPNEPMLKRNTVLEGHVVSVTASKHHSNSKIAVTFDKVKLKAGKELPVKATVMAVMGPQMMQAGEGEGGIPAEAGGAPAGGALGAGAGAGPGAGAGAAPGGGPGMEGAPPAAEASPGVPTGRSLQQHAGIPGVTLESSVHQPTSATFVSKGRNVVVPGGTEMQVAIAVIPKGVNIVH